MTEEFFGCVCGFKCIETQLAKTEGACPKCGRRTPDKKAKYDKATVEQTNFHKISRGEM